MGAVAASPASSLVLTAGKHKHVGRRILAKRNFLCAPEFSHTTLGPAFLNALLVLMRTNGKDCKVFFQSLRKKVGIYVLTDHLFLLPSLSFLSLFYANYVLPFHFLLLLFSFSYDLFFLLPFLYDTCCGSFPPPLNFSYVLSLPPTVGLSFLSLFYVYFLLIYFIFFFLPLQSITRRGP